MNNPPQSNEAPKPVGTCDGKTTQSHAGGPSNDEEQRGHHVITATDLEYHHDDTSDHTWTETYFLPIAVPEHHLLVTVYVVVRPVVGVMSAEVIAYGSLSTTRSDLLYIDSQQHLPAPERFSRIEGTNGLSVIATKPPTDYRIDYVGYDDTEIHVDWKGIMEPFDIHDAKHSPLASGDAQSQAEGSAMGEAYKGHYDLTGRVTGTVKVRGREFAVDTIDRMDHSWGPRHELGFRYMNSISVQFGEDLAFRVLAKLDPDAPTGSDQTFAHGYVLNKGELLGLTGMKLETIRLDVAVISMDMTVWDIKGEEYVLHATADVGAPWTSYPSNVTWNSMMRWQYGHRVGHGVVMEHHPLPMVNARQGRWWTDTPVGISL